MKRMLYFIVTWSDAKHYIEALTALGISYTIVSPDEELPLKEGELAFVFPSLPIRDYVKVRHLFGQTGLRY